MKRKIFTKSTVGWMFYDWAISIFSTVVTTFIFATYFTKKVAVNEIIGTAQWGDAISVAALIIALVSPIFGSIADFEGRRKPWLVLFTFLIILGSCALWFVKPSHHDVRFALTAMVVGTVGSEVAMVFYNAMLPEIAPKNYIGRFSGWAWGLGYLGGLIGLLICLYVFMAEQGALLGLNPVTAQQIRIMGPFVGFWVLVFSIPLFLFTPDRPKFGVSTISAIKLGLIQLYKTVCAVKQYKNIFKFLIARMLYIDGLNTVFAFGGIYAAGTFNLTMDQVIFFGITMHVASGLGAVSFAWMDDLVGPKLTILVALIIMFIAGLVMVSTYSSEVFWGSGCVLCLAVGPIQAASRSLMISLSPESIVTELFGLYAFSGRATAFLGPWILGMFTLHFNSQRVGMSTILIFLLLGGIVLCFVNSPRSKPFLQPTL